MDTTQEVGWDRKLTEQLVDEGIPWDKARLVVGIVAEQKQIAYMEGYNRGFNSGYAEAERKKS